MAARRRLPTLPCIWRRARRVPLAAQSVDATLVVCGPEHRSGALLVRAPLLPPTREVQQMMVAGAERAKSSRHVFVLLVGCSIKVQALSKSVSVCTGHRGEGPRTATGEGLRPDLLLFFNYYLYVILVCVRTSFVPSLSSVCRVSQVASPI